MVYVDVAMGAKRARPFRRRSSGLEVFVPDEVLDISSCLSEETSCLLLCPHRLGDACKCQRSIWRSLTDGEFNCHRNLNYHDGDDAQTSVISDQDDEYLVESRSRSHESFQLMIERQRVQSHGKGKADQDRDHSVTVLR